MYIGGEYPDLMFFKNLEKPMWNDMRDTFFFPHSIWLINHIVQFTIIPFYFIILFLIFRNEWFDGFDKINNVNIYFFKCWKTATYM